MKPSRAGEEAPQLDISDQKQRAAHFRPAVGCLWLWLQIGKKGVWSFTGTAVVEMKLETHCTARAPLSGLCGPSLYAGTRIGSRLLMDPTWLLSAALCRHTIAFEVWQRILDTF